MSHPLRPVTYAINRKLHEAFRNLCERYGGIPRVHLLEALMLDHLETEDHDQAIQVLDNRRQWLEVVEMVDTASEFTDDA